VGLSLRYFIGKLAQRESRFLGNRYIIIHHTSYEPKSTSLLITDNNLQSENRRPRKEMRCLTLSGGSKESHHQQIYCASFSDDIHVGYNTAVPASFPTTKGMGQPSGNQDKRDVIIIDSSSDDEKMAMTETSQNEKAMDDTNINSFHCHYMATCGGNHLTLYQIKSSSDESNVTNTNNSSHGTCNNENADFFVRQVYRDADEDEIFYSCLFAGRCRHRGDQFEQIPSALHKKIHSTASNHHTNLNFQQNDDDDHCGPQLCCVGGKRGVIKIIDTVQQSLIVSLIGHTDELYDLKRCPTNECIIISASNDETIRLWNLKYPSQIAIFAGHQGHREAVLSIDWHPLGEYFVSSGMDGSIKLWSVQTEKIKNAIKDSFEPPKGSERDDTYFQTVYHQLPFWATSKLHTDYVDSVAFVGDLILSKSTTNVISLLKPILPQEIHASSASLSNINDKFIHLTDYPVPECGQWYIRFGLDKDCKLLAVGNCIGDLRVWEIGGAKKPLFLGNPICNSVVRMVTFSPDAKIMVAVCDDSSVWKYNVG